MAKILTFEIPENEYEALQTMLKEFSKEIRRSHEIMQEDQAEIDRLSEEIKQIEAATQQSKAISDKILAELEAKHPIFAY